MTQDNTPVSRNIRRSKSLVDPKDRWALFKQTPCTVWLTGLSGAGKTTLAHLLEANLIGRGHACLVLDGDNIRHGLNRDLGFAAGDRSENIRRVAEVARLMNEAGLIVVTAFISPYRKDRDLARSVVEAPLETGPGYRFFEVWAQASLDVCEERDPRGLYKKARAGEIPGFTGITDPYETPEHADLVVPTTNDPPDVSCRAVLDFLIKSTILSAA